MYVCVYVCKCVFVLNRKVVLLGCIVLKIDRLTSCCCWLSNGSYGFKASNENRFVKGYNYSVTTLLVVKTILLYNT